mmetsp:Transcript_19341/g.52035  ORF Transcript_19341/g.52035 Transcript_19341/m.52035 type:complete len:233 (-) Transcript_19341:266-964(-)
MGLPLRADEGMLHGGAKDEGVVARVDVGGEERGRLCVCARDDEVGRAHDVTLKACGHEAVGVLLRGHEHLSAHMTALLRAMCLVLEVHARGAALHKHLHELHRGRNTTVASVPVCNDGGEEVGVRVRVAGAHRSLPCATVVELKSSEELVYLVGHCVLGVVGEIRAGLVGSGRGGGRLPAGHVDGGELGGHGHCLHGVECAECARMPTGGLALLEGGVKLLGHGLGRVRLVE